MARKSVKEAALAILQKCPTGIQGLDETTGDGLPKGRPTLIYGSAGSGKTLMGIGFLVRGATQYNEPGVFMSFEETEGELTANVDYRIRATPSHGPFRESREASTWARSGGPPTSP